MNKLLAVIFLTGMVLVLVGAGQVNAQEQAPQGTPPTQQMLEEIRSTRGVALLKYYPQYARLPIPVVGGVRIVQHSNVPTAKMIEEINATRGAALLKYWDK